MCVCLPAEVPKLQSIAAGVAAAVLLSVAPANAGVILEQPQIKKVRLYAAQLRVLLLYSGGMARTDQCRTVFPEARQLRAMQQASSQIGQQSYIVERGMAGRCNLQR
jgi:hypothetical protein